MGQDRRGAGSHLHRGGRPAGSAGAEQVHPDLRFRPGHLHLPGQLHPHPLLLRLRLQPAGSDGRRIWTRRSPRSPTARPSARPPTWSPSWPTSSASATICSSARATSIRRPSWTRVDEGYRDGILEQQPTLVNLQCDVDHPTQCMADMLHIIHRVRRRGEPEGQEGRHDMGLLPLLRQAPLRAAGRHRPDDPLRHGRGAGPSRRL